MEISGDKILNLETRNIKDAAVMTVLRPVLRKVEVVSSMD